MKIGDNNTMQTRAGSSSFISEIWAFISGFRVLFWTFQASEHFHVSQKKPFHRVTQGCVWGILRDPWLVCALVTALCLLRLIPVSVSEHHHHNLKRFHSALDQLMINRRLIVYFKLVPQIDPSVPRPVVQSRRRPLLGPSPGWKCLLALSHLRHY